ncbi:DUF6913 domain-containing protein [Robertkochia solimangrovi]|uniref:DUF6913 domain-containing protein n=1 Tax=Robertkochia solimangrovi TaxID=2213046 RepID=UPI00117F1F13|nr:hypothetical protein [Robertkochia solimangrovi]TRZ41071.1 hypothetical protein DMZ48_18265 [Robertkochia solimangrovi]
MILKSLKEKSVYKIIEEESGKKRTSSQGEGKFRSLAIIINYDKLVDYRPLLNLANALDIPNESVHMLGYVEKAVKNVNYLIPVFSPKSIGVKGKVKDDALEDFLKKDYDLLVNYYSDPVIEMMLVSALTRSDFKVGISDEHAILNDLILKVGEGNFRDFQEELIKYLKILKKL